MTELQHDLWLISPEICLVGFVMLIQMIGLNSRLEKFTGWMAIFGIGCAIYFLLNVAIDAQGTILRAFNGSIILTIFEAMYKLLVLSFAIPVIITYIGYTKAKNQPVKSEYIVFILLSLVGAGIAISAASLIVLFMSLELQALIGYMLASFDRDKPGSAEAGLKYFILGALASCLILLGMSFLYGFSGSVLYIDITSHVLNIGIVTGAILLLCGFMFKLSAAPFHMWTPDVYEGAPLPSMVFFASISKITIVCVLIGALRYIVLPTPDFALLIKTFAILSMLVGSIGGAIQESVKRLIAYSTILNLGFVLIPFVHSDNMNLTPLIYLTIYAVTTIGFLALLIIALGKKVDEARLSDLRAFAQNNKVFAALISILVFSLIGLPPFAGFFGKYYVISNAIANEEYLLTTIAVLSSVIAAFYYLKIVKSMYFEEVAEPCVARSNFYLSFVAAVTVIFTVIFGFIG